MQRILKRIVEVRSVVTPSECKNKPLFGGEVAGGLTLYRTYVYLRTTYVLPPRMKGDEQSRDIIDGGDWPAGCGGWLEGHPASFISDDFIAVHRRPSPYGLRI
jgi:hypothetical protein